MEEFLKSNTFKWILSILIVILGWLIGILINKFIYKKIKNISQKTHRRYYYIIVKKIKNLITIILVLIATYIAVNIAPISTDILKYVNNILKILLIITITLLISRLLSNYVQYLLKKSNKLTSKTSIFNVIIDILIYNRYYYYFTYFRYFSCSYFSFFRDRRVSCSFSTTGNINESFCWHSTNVIKKNTNRRLYKAR